MKLEELKPKEGSKKKRKRIGRGTGSGHGTTATKGNKGQRARSGGAKGKGFEGGQMPITRRIPKRGFKNPFRKEYSIVKVGDLQIFKGKEIVEVEDFINSGLVKKIRDGIKLLSDGEIDFPLVVKVHRASKKAIEKIKDKGGKVEVIAS
ncbi:MAG: 50S ribosomal protein L15 [Deltaproteobacteria bacterium]|nr:50S ribosomal protein L15 [Deltaproteobacteria bacterium]